MTAQGPGAELPASLDEFLSEVRRNEEGAGGAPPDYFAHLNQIYSVFKRFTDHLDHPEVILLPFLAVRSFAAFVAGSRLALGGMSPEVMPAARLCLEYALYGFRMYRDWVDREADRVEEGSLSLQEIWLRRDESGAAHEAAMEAFRPWKIIVQLTESDTRLGNLARALYDASITAGAHPNPQGVTGSLTYEEGETSREFYPDILVADSVVYRHGIIMLAKIAILALSIFELTYRERFRILSLSDMVASLQLEHDRLNREYRDDLEQLPERRSAQARAERGI